MRLVHLEANDPRFGPIVFRDGLNVIFARVRDPSIQKNSSHNLGKSFLIDVLDFTLGKDVDKAHPFKRRKDRFGGFVFTLQLRTNEGRYVSVRRPVQGRASCAVMVRDTQTPVGAYPEDGWDYSGLGLEAYVSQIDTLVGLSDLGSFSFRKGLGYQLRRQTDYADEFQLERYQRAYGRDWVPLVAILLGFDVRPFQEAYDAEKQIDDLEKTLKGLTGDRRRSPQYDDVRARIQVREAEIEALRGELDRFQFVGVERQINHGLVHEIEAAIAERNLRRYAIDRDLEDIRQSESAPFELDLDLVRRVYHRAGVELPGLLVKDLDELMNFHRRISADRNVRLVRLRGELEAERARLEEELTALDARRQEALAGLQEAESLVKYRQLTAQVLLLEQNLRSLRDKLAVLDEAARLEDQRGQQKKALVDAQARVRDTLRRSNPLFEDIRRRFADAAREVIGASATLSAALNQAEHLEVRTAILDRVTGEGETFEGEGNSYKKMLCACVDQAMLQAHVSGSYFRFLYHDGIFEGLYNRRKVGLLDHVRRMCREHELQYILTVIDTDLPRDARDQKLLFTREEVVLELHDGGDDGRLFRMALF